MATSALDDRKPDMDTGRSAGSTTIMEDTAAREAQPALRLAALQGLWHTSRLGPVVVRGDCAVYQFIGASSRGWKLKETPSGAISLGDGLWQAEVESGACRVVYWFRRDDPSRRDLITWVKVPTDIVEPCQAKADADKAAAAQVRGGTATFAPPDPTVWRAGLPTAVPVEHRQEVIQEVIQRFPPGMLSALQGEWETSCGKVVVNGHVARYPCAGDSKAALKWTSERRLCIGPFWRAQFVPTSRVILWTRADDSTGEFLISWVRPRDYAPPEAAASHSRKRRAPAVPAAVPELPERSAKRRAKQSISVWTNASGSGLGPGGSGAAEAGASAACPEDPTT